MGELGDEHRGHAVNRGRAFFRHHGQRRAGIETGSGQQDCRAGLDARDHADDAAEAVIERHRHAHPIRFRVLEPAGKQRAVVHQVVMRQQHALGRSGRARGVLNVHDIMRIDRWIDRGDRPGLAPQRGCRAGGPLPGPDALPGFFVEEDRMAQRAVVAGTGVLEDLPVACARILRPQEQRLHAGLAQDVAQLVGSVRGVDVDEDQPRARGRQLQQDPFGAVAGPDADAIAGDEPEVEQPAGHAIDFRQQLPIRESLLLMPRDEGERIRHARGRRSEQLAKRQVKKR